LVFFGFSEPATEPDRGERVKWRRETKSGIFIRWRQKGFLRKFLSERRDENTIQNSFKGVGLSCEIRLGS